LKVEATITNGGQENANMNGGAGKNKDSEIMILPSERAAGMEARDVLSYMRVNPAVGLTVTEASGRRNLHGFNEVSIINFFFVNDLPELVVTCDHNLCRGAYPIAIVIRYTCYSICSKYRL
jgi:hypothetical protein